MPSKNVLRIIVSVAVWILWIFLGVLFEKRVGTVTGALMMAVVVVIIILNGIFEYWLRRIL